LGEALAAPTSCHDRGDLSRLLRIAKAAARCSAPAALVPVTRDILIEPTLAVADKVVPGFGEQTQAVNLEHVPTATPRSGAQVRKQQGGGTVREKLVCIFI